MQKTLIILWIIVLSINLNFINVRPATARNIKEKNISNLEVEKILARKYCDSREKNLFKGLDNESILKYEYFFSWIPTDSIKDKDKFIILFKSDVKSICSYEISKSTIKEFNNFF